MPSQYLGIPSNATAGASKTINGATNATPIVISTTTPHGFNGLDIVAVGSVGGNLGANGVWTIVIVDSTHFQLSGSLGTGAYTSGGTAVQQAVTPTYAIPSAGDPFTANAFNVAYTALGDKIQYLAQQINFKIVTFTVTSTWVAPAGCSNIIIQGCGSGGGGGGGPTTASSSANFGNAPGGGGGGSSFNSYAFSVITNGTYTITVPAGGAGGAAGASGSDGGDVTFTGPGGVSFAFYGGQGGKGFGPGLSTTTYPGSGLQGAAASSRLFARATDLIGVTSNVHANVGAIVLPPQYGGYSELSNLALFEATLKRGGASLQGFLGGLPGTDGTNNGTFLGGPAGSGGGAGPFGVGAIGGNGGNGSAGVGSAATNGSSAAAATGAGGGGGGSGGAGSGGGGAGGTGGNGGSGRLTIIYLAMV
jgi:hypothetical protein